MSFQASAGSGRIQGSVTVNSEDVSGDTFELAKGEQGEKLLADTIKQAKENQKQQQAASNLENLDNKLGNLLYATGEDSGASFSDESQSVEAAIESVKSNAKALRETLKNTIKADMEDRESANKDVQEVLEDYRAGKTSAEDACFDISYDRSDFSQSNGISDSNVEEYRQARDTLKQSEQTLDGLMANAKETLKKLKSAQENAPDDTPTPRYDEGDVKQLHKEAEAAHKKADSALKETKSKREGYEKRAQEASDKVVASFDEIGINNDTACYELSDETSPSQGSSGDNSGDSDTGGDTSSSDDSGDSGSSSLQSFISEYYKAIEAEDWEATYSMLDSESQEVYTESEWSDLQEAREEVSPLPPVSSVETSKTTKNDDGITYVEVVLNPGTNSETISFANVSLEDGEYHRHLTEGDISYYNDL